MIDEIDRQIVRLLQEDARLSNAALAEQVGLSASTVYERVKKLESKGVIKGYTAVVDPIALDKPIAAFVRLTIGASPSEGYSAAKRDLLEQILAESDVMECHTVAGEDCYILKVRAGSPKELEKLLERIRSNGLVSKSVSSIVLSTYRESMRIEPA